MTITLPSRGEDLEHQPMRINCWRMQLAVVSLSLLISQSARGDAVDYLRDSSFPEAGEKAPLAGCSTLLIRSIATAELAASFRSRRWL